MSHANLSLTRLRQKVLRYCSGVGWSPMIGTCSILDLRVPILEVGSKR